MDFLSHLLVWQEEELELSLHYALLAASSLAARLGERERERDGMCVCITI